MKAVTKTIIITEKNKNSLIVKRVLNSVEKKEIIKKHIRSGKKLDELNEKGIKFRMPV